MRAGVTAVVPAIPPRMQTHLHRALDSVLMQQSPVAAVSVAVDHVRAGAAANRNRAFNAVETEWTAFLDDDDTWEPCHVGALLAHAEATGADMVYPWFTVVDGFDPFPDREGATFDPEELKRRNFIPITVLIRTVLLRDVGGFWPKGPPENPCEDWETWERVVAAGGRISHLPRRTWNWHWHSGNTSGRSDRW